MRATTIRWPDRMHAAVHEAAEASGSTFSSYVKEACIVRAAFDAGIAAGLQRNPGFKTEGQDLIAVREGAYRAAIDWMLSLEERETRSR